MKPKALLTIAIAAVIAMMAIAIQAHAAEVFSRHKDWSVIELTDWETDSKIYIAVSDDATIRRAHFPYKGPYNLQYECVQHQTILTVFSNGVNLRHDGTSDGRVKFDDKPTNFLLVGEGKTPSDFVFLYPTDVEWKNMVTGNRMRVWMPYYGGDIIVDFSLAGFTAAAKRAEELNGCGNSLMAEVEVRKESAIACERMVGNYFATMKRPGVAGRYKEKRRAHIDASCSWMGDALGELYSKYAD